MDGNREIVLTETISLLAEMLDEGAVSASRLESLLRGQSRKLDDPFRRISKNELLSFYLKSQDPDDRLVKLLRSKPRRTASGVATVTVLMKPWPCGGDCICCPNDIRMPKSYLSDEPACQRAERWWFDPYLQVASRIRVLEDMGHNTDKVELIVLGGTFDDYPREYRIWFI